MNSNNLRSRGRPKDESKRIALLKAARELFLKRGVEVTTDEVATAAGVAKATLYGYFKDKEDLIEAVIREESEQVISDELVEVTPDAPFETVIRNFGIKYVRFVNQTDVAGWDRLIAHGSMRTPELPHRFYEAGPGRWHDLLVRLIQTGAEQGYLKVSDCDQAAEDLTALWMGTTSLRVKLGVSDPIGDEFILNKVQHGLTIFNAFYGSPE